jgi:hypothetical protein
MADFVRNDIGFRELAGVAVSATAEFILEVVKERTRPRTKKATQSGAA